MLQAFAEFPHGALRQSARFVGALVLALILYACSFVPARLAILWLDHWRMIPYRPVNSGVNRFYAPVLWMDDHIPAVQEAGMAVDRKMRSLAP